MAKFWILQLLGICKGRVCNQLGSCTYFILHCLIFTALQCNIAHYTILSCTLRFSNIVPFPGLHWAVYNCTALIQFFWELSVLKIKYLSPVLMSHKLSNWLSKGRHRNQNIPLFVKCLASLDTPCTFVHCLTKACYFLSYS